MPSSSFPSKTWDARLKTNPGMTILIKSLVYRFLIHSCLNPWDLFFAQLLAQGWPRHFQKLVGERALPMVNDPLHKKIRTLNSRAFADRQLDSYLPKLQRLSAKYLESWVGKPSSDLHFEVGKNPLEKRKLCETNVSS